MELANAELKIIMNALFDKIADDDLPADEMVKILALHNKIGAYLNLKGA